MKVTLLILFLAYLLDTLAMQVNNRKPMFCTRQTISSVRIGGCSEEPCTIKKGVKVPIEIDFQFEKPLETSIILFDVFIGYWTRGGPQYGSYLAQENNCTELGLASCPVNAGQSHTLKSNIFIHPESMDSLTGNTTGNRVTRWSLSPTLRKNDEESYSSCFFTVKLAIVE